MVSFKEQWFGPITPDNVEAVIAHLGKGWYALGVLYLVPYCYLAWMEGVYSANVVDGFLSLVDVFIYLTGGYFLIRRKSRALAGALLAYALLDGAFTFLRWFGVIASQGGTNNLLAAFAVVLACVLAWRGCRATSVYQRKMGHKVSWKHVSWILLSIILFAPVVFVVTFIFLKIVCPQINDDMVGNLTVAVMAVFAVAFLTTLTRRYPFHSSPAEPSALPPSTSSPQVLVDQYIRAAHRDASAVMEAIGAVALPIVAGSWQCTQAVTPYLKPNHERFTKEPLVQQSYILNEFLYFFIHIMKRHANDQLSDEESQKLQAIVLPLVIRSGAVDTFFAHWPQEYRSGIECDFYKVLDDVENDYTTRTEQLVARGDTYAGSIPPQFAHLRVELALCSRLALSILDLAGYEVEEGRPVHEIDFPFATMVAGEATKVLSVGDLRNFRELVARAGEAITVYESSRKTPLTESVQEFWARSATPPCATHTRE